MDNLENLFHIWTHKNASFPPNVSYVGNKSLTCVMSMSGFAKPSFIIFGTF